MSYTNTYIAQRPASSIDAMYYGGQTEAERHLDRCMSQARDIVSYAARGDVVMAVGARRTLNDLTGGEYPAEVQAYLRRRGH